MVFYVVDVSGHGVPASLLSVSVTRSLTTNQKEQSVILKSGNNTSEFSPELPRIVASRLNRMFPMEQNGDQYFTMVYGLLDVRESILDFVCAGHHGPVVVRADGGIETFELPGFFIGFDVAAEYESASIELKPGDRVFFYSDGIIEQPSRDQERFGTDRFVELLQNTPPDSLLESTNRVIAALQRWSEGVGFEDDISLLAFELNP